MCVDSTVVYWSVSLKRETRAPRSNLAFLWPIDVINLKADGCVFLSCLWSARNTHVYRLLIYYDLSDYALCHIRTIWHVPYLSLQALWTLPLRTGGINWFSLFSTALRALWFLRGNLVLFSTTRIEALGARVMDLSGGRSCEVTALKKCCALTYVTAM